MGPHEVSLQNCLMAPAMTGPRQRTGSVSFWSSRLELMTLTPCSEISGSIRLPRAWTWRPLMPNILGIEGPVMVGIEDADLVAVTGKLGGDGTGDKRLADTALAGKARR